jgi:hypothetical protein
MISDILSQAVIDMREYMAKLPDLYVGKKGTPLLLALIETMDAMRRVLDTPPHADADLLKQATRSRRATR